MPLITGEQYTESTRALNLPVYIFGKKVENPVDDPILRPALSSVRIENLCFGTVAVGYRTESMHGAGSPQAQRIMIARQGNLDHKKGLPRPSRIFRNSGLLHQQE